MPRSQQKKKHHLTQRLSQSIPDLFRTSSRSKMAASRSSSPVEHSEEETPDPGDLTPASMFRNIQRMFRTELTKAVTDPSSQLQELGQRVADTEARVDDLAEAVEADKKELEDHSSQLQALELKLEDLENRSRRANLRIRGLPEEVTDLTKTITSLFFELVPHLEPEMLPFDRIHRALSRPKNPDLPRDVILKLHYPEVRDMILQAARNVTALPGVPATVHIYSDLAPSTLARRRDFRPVILALQKEGIRYRWGFPFSLSFQIKGHSHTVRTYSEAQEVLTRARIPLVDQPPLPQRPSRASRAWTPVGKDGRASKQQKGTRPPI
ncbi:uncharacterized protein LOC130356605 [Hyla sarda]|uniref:uncharacterized protein LOC130356605 n=1 Tax=Hyla sarda TaxID=327740 RepID=UPI0024C2C2C3|nr:uncharacterized protein LOC130356605 [Hyla sarda]